MLQPDAVIPLVAATIRGEFAAAVEEFRFGSQDEMDRQRLQGLMQRALHGVAPSHRVGKAEDWVAWSDASKLSEIEAMRQFVEGVARRPTLSELSSPKARPRDVFQAARTDATALVTFAERIHDRDAEGRTPLIHAVDAGNLEGAALLLRVGARPNEADDQGRTPLHYAAAIGSDPLARLLLDNGADPSVRNVTGKLPTDLAMDNRHDALAVVVMPRLEVRLPTQAAS